MNKPDVLKIHLGNILLNVASLLAVAAAAFQVRGYSENTLSSRIWLTRIMKDTMFVTKGIQKIVHFCKYGTRRRKPTIFMVWGKGISDWMPLVCSGLRKYERIGQSHLITSGKFNGKFRTILAQPYPAPLCHELIHNLRRSED